MQISSEEIEKLLKNATFMSVSVAIVIIVMKMWAWFVTDSLSLLSSLVDSILDVASSIVSFIAVRYSLQPPDDEHRFGHGKAEDIAAFSQSVFIGVSGIFILIEAITRMIKPQPVANEMVGIIVMFVATLFTLALISYQKYVIAKTNSTAIKADALHYKTDILINFLVIVSFLSAMIFEAYIVDPIFSLIVSIYIFISAFTIGRHAFDKLMDKEFSNKERLQIIQCIESHKDSRGFHDLKTRNSGVKPFIQFHLELDIEISLLDAHRISNEIEMEILKFFPNADILIHQDVKSR